MAWLVRQRLIIVAPGAIVGQAWEVTAAKIVARGLDNADLAKLDELLASGVLKEVSDER